MNIKERAKIFAIKAHMGQVRKSEPDKPMIIHPISVGELLELYGYDDNVVAAGYLHDVVEDTKYTIEDIKKEFGDDIANLVYGASEPDKSLSWEERKQHTINITKKLPIRNKLVICADKINNLEDLFIKFQKSGERDFSKFKRGEEKQKWYYTSIYESLIAKEDKNLEIFKRLKDVIDKVYGSKENLYLKETIFENNQSYYEKLKRLHAAKMELQKLKSLSKLEKPFVIEFSGTPRTGKTTIINNLYDFFKKGGFDVSIIEEFTTSKYYKEEIKPTMDDMTLKESNLKIIEIVSEQLQEEVEKKKDIIIIDRSINDRQIWNYRRYKRNDIDEESYLEAREKYKKISQELIDFLVITTADPLTSLRRDYLSSLALEDRTFLNTNNIEEYNQALQSLNQLFHESVSNYVLIDTSDKSVEDTTINITEQIIPAMRGQYIKSFKDRYKIQ